MTNDEQTEAVERYKAWIAERRAQAEAEKVLPLYEVAVRIRGTINFMVRANSEDEAIQKAADRFEGGDEGQSGNDWDWDRETVRLVG
jgi:hypothetical protein